MKIEFDPAKDVENVRKHGLSFAAFNGWDESPRIVVDDRLDYGETRLRAFGRINGTPHCIVFTYRDEVLRLISFRRAHEKELRRYE